MVYQIGLFCMPQLADAECPKAAQIGGSARALARPRCSHRVRFAWPSVRRVDPGLTGLSGIGEVPLAGVLAPGPVCA